MSGRSMKAASNAPSFSDKRVFVVGINDPRTHRLHTPDHLAVEQMHDGPRFVVIGPEVSDDCLARNLPDIAARYGVTLPSLVAVRDAQRLA